jgi:hypothetical protein
MADISVKVGKKGNDSKVDKKKTVKGQKPAQAAGAEAQRAVGINASCWNCWAINYIVGDTNFYVGFYCWNCAAYNEA